MKTLLIAVMLLLISTTAHVPMPLEVKYAEAGITVIEFNASFNASNSVSWVKELSDCQGKRIDIGNNPLMQKTHKIVVVPTIIVFKEKEEVKRFQANILMQMEATQQDVQEAVDKILMSSF